MASLIVKDSGHNRIEVYLHEKYPDFSRNYFAKNLDKGLILLNGKSVKRGTFLKLDDQIEIPNNLLANLLGSARVNLSELELEVLEEYPNYLVINKPREMHCVLQSQEDPPTLADLIYEKYPETKNAGRSKKESGLVQRLDFYTSGIMLAARNRETWEKFHEMFINKEITKTYLALLEGNILRDFEEETYSIKLIETQNGNSLVRFRTKYGDRHVVRKSCATLGYPLLGDVENGSSVDHVSILKNDSIFVHKGFYLEAIELKFPDGFSPEKFSL